MSLTVLGWNQMYRFELTVLYIHIQTHTGEAITTCVYIYVCIHTGEGGAKTCVYAEVSEHTYFWTCLLGRPRSNDTPEAKRKP